MYLINKEDQDETIVGGKRSEFHGGNGQEIEGIVTKVLAAHGNTSAGNGGGNKAIQPRRGVQGIRKGRAISLGRENRERKLRELNSGKGQVSQRNENINIKGGIKSK